MLDFTHLYTIDINGITHICRIIFYDILKNTYSVSLRGNGVLNYIEEDQLTDISNALPKEYTQVSYIESSGTQYIDTGLEGKDGYTLEATLKFTEFPGNYSYFAGFGSSSSNRIYFTRAAKATLTDGWTYNSDSHNLTDVSVATDTEYVYKSVMENGKQELYRNGTLLDSDNVVGTPSYGTIWIFGADYNDSINGGTSCQLFACKFSYGGKVVRDFIPCYRNSDNEIGLYDTVGRQFYTNSGTGSFIIETPGDYQYVEYIESSGTQYINTGFSPDNKSKMFLDYQPTVAQSKMFAGTRTVGGNAFTINSGSANTYMFAAWGQSGNKQLASMTTDRVTTEISQDGIYYNDELKYNLSTATWHLTGKVLLFAVMQSGAADLHASVRIFSCKLYADGVLIRDFIPCYRKVDGEIGMLDSVNNVFYTNDGTGTFVKGRNV